MKSGFILMCCFVSFVILNTIDSTDKYSKKTKKKSFYSEYITPLEEAGYNVEVYNNLKNKKKLIIINCIESTQFEEGCKLVDNLKILPFMEFQICSPKEIYYKNINIAKTLAR